MDNPKLNNFSGMFKKLVFLRGTILSEYQKGISKN